MKQVLGLKMTASKITASVFTALLAVAMLVAVPDADAKRMGGGRSVGKNSQTTQRDAAPANNASSNTTSPAAAPSAAAKAPAAAPAPASNRSKWLGPLAGLAAGLGLAALASHFGFGEGLANFMMIALLAMVAFAAFRFFMAKRAANNANPNTNSNMNSGMTPAYAGASAGSGSNESSAYKSAMPAQNAAPVGYSGASGAYTGGIGSAIADGGLQTIAGFDEAGFVRQAKVYFVRLQADYDAANQKDLREFTSPEMFAELMMEINERNGAVNRTEVEKLDAELLGQGQDGTHEHVSVRFHGLVKEFEGAKTHADSTAINETWNFARPTNGSEGWTLVGIEQNA
jgi:predicted lipid-binding transport protein (Tim44 family)